jgi:uncharacterized protein (DUF1499 family)
MGIIAFLLAACAGDRPGNLGVKDGALVPCPSSPNCVSSFAGDERHRIDPLAFTGDADEAFSRLKRVLAAREDSSVVEEGEGYLRVELRTRLFVDDAEFLLDRARRVIQLRSASRVGYSDLGKNRRRMEEIRARFAAAE